MSSKLSRNTAWLLFVIFFAALFYFWQLGRHDIVTDESSYATRAIGMVDFDFGIEQPTPWQWVRHVSWWMRLSFHDHPPLVFLLQHSSMKLFGENPIAIRIPSALAGIASVILLYFVGKRLYSPSVGLASAALFAFTANHVWISRIGLQESVLIALMLATFYFFIRALLEEHSETLSVTIGRPIVTDRKSSHQKRKDGLWLAGAGFFLGLAFLTKYNALILFPICATIAFLRWRSLSLRFGFHLLISIFLFLAMASPVIIYNIQLYRNFGHFDFQFSLLLHQNVKEWQSRPGQEALGSYANRLTHYLPWLGESNSPYFLIVGTAGLALFLADVFRRRARAHAPVLATFGWLLPFFLFIGPAPRFLTMLAPWLALAAGYALVTLGDIIGRQFVYSNPAGSGIGIDSGVVFARFASITLIMGIVIIEALYSYNSVIALMPRGASPWTYARLLRSQTGSWGFNELEGYFAGELRGKAPEVAITFQFPFAREILDRANKTAQEKRSEFVPWGIVYNDNINLSASLWIFLRRITYEGWPVMSAENFRSGGGREFLIESGIKKIYFVNPTSAALQDRTVPPTPDGDLLEVELKRRGVLPKEIKDPTGEVAFRVYQIILEPVR